MFTRLFVRGQVAASSLMGRLEGRARGANFLEYALLMGLAILIFAFFKNEILSVLKQLFERIASAVGGADRSTIG
jgi:Flp pilus assembly pilin Flp